MNVAKSIVKELESDESMCQIIFAYRHILENYIKLANTSTKKMEEKNHTKGISFREIQNRGELFCECLDIMHELPSIVTLNHPISKDLEYDDNVIRTQAIIQTFSVTDHGLSRPKIISCRGTDGHIYKQLVKGGDDMRQDAVMEQVFQVVNHTLSRDNETMKRKLRIRTYKIVPTTPQTGVLQWVEDTIAFGGILSHSVNGTHHRYHPNDWTHSKCREYLKSAENRKDQHNRFLEICENFNPAFRFFFLENFLTPTSWVTSRTNYIRSVAVNSIIGYILGIGDRHAHNILVDTFTGEVVHIDFGIVYEQGKGLGIPETVPFRLTRDIEDGMGIAGLEGTFRCCCEEVLRVLRDNVMQIITIPEVIIYDPLYKWSLSPLQARLKQNLGNMRDRLVVDNVSESSSFSKDAAERTLQRIKNKLQGLEDPSGEALSIEGQVDFVIGEARSTINLCKIFQGWAPWL